MDVVHLVFVSFKFSKNKVAVPCKEKILSGKHPSFLRRYGNRTYSCTCVSKWIHHFSFSQVLILFCSWFHCCLCLSCSFLFATLFYTSRANLLQEWFSFGRWCSGMILKNLCCCWRLSNQLVWFQSKSFS